MKIVRFMAATGCMPRIGVLSSLGVVDLAVAYRSLLLDKQLCTKESAFELSETTLPADTVRLLEHGEIALEAAREAIDFIEQSWMVVNQGGETAVYRESDVHLLAPIERPRNLRDFLSFEQHLKNTRSKRNAQVPEEWYVLPVYYKGSTTSIVGPNTCVDWPSYTNYLDYELEIACVIGKTGKNISAADADDFVFGYTIMNDFSARDVQFREMSVGLGPAKGKDFATALGPCIVTKDEIPDPYNLTMTARVNGELWSEGSTSTMYRKFPQMIEHASSEEELVPGDVIGSGTVGFGCGFEMDRRLAAGDTVELEIEGLGILRNQIGQNPR